MLQCVAAWCNSGNISIGSAICERGAVYCSELRCVAVCCNVLQCVAVFGSVLQCVAASNSGNLVIGSATRERSLYKCVLYINVFFI